VLTKFSVSVLLLGAAACAAPQPGAVAPTAAPLRPANAVWPDEGPATWAPRPTEPAITANDLRTRLYQFADDSMRGRKVGDIGNVKGTDYIASEFKRLGLQPAGENGTYFQTIPYGTNAFVLASARLDAGGAALAPKVEWVPVPANSGSGITENANVANAQAVFAGRWGDTTTHLDPAAIRGKVAVFTAPARATGGRAGRGGTFTFVRDPRASDAGAALVLVAALDEMPGNAVAITFDARPGMRVEPAPGAPAAAISNAAAAKIFGRALDQLSVGTAGGNVSASWTTTFKAAPYPSRNVIAIKRGADPRLAAEYVLVGAHNDHVGMLAAPIDHDSVRAFNRIMRPQGANDPVRKPNAAEQKEIDALIAHARSIRPPQKDSVMNGADDDGSGTVILLEIAEKFASEHPARSIIFISHVGEEAGLLGSRWFTDHPTIPLDSVVAAHNMDMDGRGRVTDVKFGGPNSVQTLGSRRLSREFGDIIDSVNAVIANPMAIDRSWDVPANPMNRFCRSDQVNYVHHNVPVTYFSTGYTIDYHQATDEPRYIDYDKAARVGNFIHDIMWAIANRADKPKIAGPDPAYPQCR